ncbi:MULTISPECIES: LuxR family transcriptional regulator [unclassified Streptomyces]|uniref:helix-turn-helix transcriptional regulator n=1 Tax=unclassified Streptomyces TaxID=2593676 RepID=UPI001E3B54E7|nr:LuxR family transcriptional regulator [Streptomyces sp. CB02980]MCB8907999.1 AAA family ATPase [Streptomyces sp. CB02980]
MVVIEKYVELQSLKRMLNECTTNGRTVALVTGPGGVGKTTLLSSFSGFAKSAGALVLSASGARSGQLHPLGVLSQLFRSIELSTEQGERFDRLLALQGADSLDSSLSACAVDELTEILLEAAGGQPLVLAVDDTQYADPASMHALLLMLRRLASSPVVAVFAEWRIFSSKPPLVLAEFIKQPYFHLLNLQPLSLEGVTEWLRQRRLGEASAECLAPSFLAATGGSPLLLQALFQDQCRGFYEREPGDADSVSAMDAALKGAHFKVAVEACLHRWDPQLLDVARGLAVLGAPTSADVLARLLTSEQRTVVEALNALAETGLLRSGWFSHQAARAAALSGLGGEALAALYERTALLLHSDGAVPSEVAERLVAAGGIAENWSVDVLRNAAWQALREGNPSRAAEFLEVARQACGDAQERAEVMGALVRVLWLTKPTAVTSLLVPLYSLLQDGSLATRDIVALSTFLAWQGRADEAALALDRVEMKEDECDLTGAAELALARQWIRWVVPFKGTDGAEETSSTRRPEQKVECESWSDLAKSAEQVLQCCRIADALPVTVLSALLVLTFDDRLDAAQAWCETLRPEAEALQAVAWVAMLAAVQGLVAARRGDLVDAERHSRRAVTVMPQHNWGAALGLPLSCLVHATTAMGKTDEAETLIKEALPEARRNPFWLHFLHARGRFYIENNRPYAALADFQTCGRLLSGTVLDHANFVPWRSDLAEAWLRLDDARSAKGVLDEQLTLANVDNKRVRGRTLRITAATLKQPARASMLRDAVKVLLDSGDRLELALALADSSDAELECGHFAEFRLISHQAKRMAKMCGAEPLYWRLQNSGSAEEPGETPTLRKTIHRFALLSEAERKVAALAAQGRSNREISQTLFITVSTVEQHLTKTYRKLGVSSRFGLPVELGLVGSADH